ncbi:MAG: hypothetical protein LBE74_03535 [Treponema sp.]|jgi:chromosome segregation ATPase|nr:hypothetical protein [Treponema sp.]
MFTLGNFITLGIVVLALIFYRQLDKRNRTLDKVRKYADHLKNELTAFVTEKENAVKDYSVSLDVEQKSAKELMKRVQITDAELAEKAKAIAKIDERITAYDSSLEELVRMTARVQENLTRLREESTFIESVNKKIMDAQNKFNVVERQTAELKQGFVKENSAYLERLAGEILADVKSSVAELKAQSQAVERYVGEQRTAMEKAEHIRAANLQRDMDILNRTLKTVMERAANKADSLEVEILENLKAESEERIQDLKSSIEETFKDSQSKAQEQLDKVRSLAEENQSMWEAHRIAFEAKEQSRREKLSADIEALSAALVEKTELLKKASAEDEARSAKIRAYIVSQNDALEQKFNETKQRIDETLSLLETRIKNVSGEVEQRALEKADERFGNWRQILHESDADLQKTLSSLESSSIDIQDHFARETGVLKQRLKDIERQIETGIVDLRDQIERTSEESQAHVAEEAASNLEQLLRTHEEQNDRLVRSVQELEVKAESIKGYFDDETAAISKKFSDTETRVEEAVAGFEERLQRTAASAERKVLQSADVRLEDWKKAAVDADAKLRDLLIELEASTETARANFDAEKSRIAQKLADASLQTERTIDGLKESITRASESVEAKIADEADAKLQQWLAVSEDRNDKAKLILEELEQTAERAKAAFAVEAAAMDKRLEEAKVRSEQTIDSWSANMELRLRGADEKLADTETYVERAILDSEKRIAAAVAEAELSALEKADAELAEWRKRFEEQMADRDRASEEEVLQNRQRFEDLAKSFDETKERLVREIEETKEKLAEAKVRADQAVASWESDAELRLREVAEKLADTETYVEHAILDLEKRIAAAAVDAELSAWEKTDTKLAEWRKRFEEQMADCDRASEEEAVQSRQRFEDLAESFDETKERLVKEIEEIEDRQAGVQEKMDTAIERIEDAIRQAVEATDEKADFAAKNRFLQWQEASKQAVSEAEARDSAFLARFNQDYEQAVTEAEKLKSSLIVQFNQSYEKASAEAVEWTDNLVAQFKKTAEENEERSKNLIAQWERVFTETSAQNAAELSAVKESFVETKQRIADEITSAELRLHSIQEKVDETVRHIEYVVKDAVVSVDAKAAMVAEDRLAQWKQADQQAAVLAKERGEDLVAQWERAWTEISAQNAAAISVVEANFSETKQRIVDEIAGIESHLQDAKGNVDRTIEHVDSAAKDLVDGAERRLQTIRAEIDNAIFRIESAVKDAVSGVDAQAASAADDRLAQWKQASEQAIAAAEEQTNNFIEQFKKDTDENIERNKVLLEQWKTAAETLAVQDRAQLAALRDSWNQTKNQWSGEIIDAENRLKFLETQIKESSAHIGTVMKEAVEHAETTAHNQADKRIEEWRRAVQQTEEQARQILADFETSLSSARQNLANESEAMEERFKSIGMDAQDMIDKLEQQLQQSAEDIEQRILDSTDAKFEEYRKAQFEQFQRFDSLADDAAMLDEELRRYLAETQTRVKKDFSAFEQASSKEQAMALADFTAASNSLKTEMGNIEKNITALKETAYNNISEKLNFFENDFSLNLAKRSDEIDKRLDEWRQYLDNQLKMLVEDAESKRKTIETSYTEKLTAKLAENNNSWLMELEKLKSEAGDFEENIRVQMKIADDSLVSLKEQFIQDMEDARSFAESSLKSEIGRYNLALSDTLKQNQRDMESKLKRLQDDLETRNGEIVSLFETSRRSADEWKAVFNNQLRDLETALEETRKRSKDLVAESNDRLSSVRASLEDVRTEADAHRAELFSRIDEQARSLDAAIKEADRHIKDFANQTSLFERADTLKVELEHYIEDLHSDLDKIDQHKTESADLENQFIRIKRLEDEVNAKMTRFLSEKHRIEQMETEFNRLLQTSKAVDEKLAQLSASDDTLQAMQVQIRKFNDALDTSEEKFKRIERKNQTLDATNEGIDRNFKTLQESEQIAQRIGGELTYLSSEMSLFRTNIGDLAKESEKAKSAAEKISTLDATLSEIDQRIATVQASREWLARLETRLEELNKQAQDQVKLIGTLMKDSGVPLKGAKGAPPIGTRENVIKLSQQGWTVDEIARAQKLGRGEVELILELAHNG